MGNSCCCSSSKKSNKMIVERITIKRRISIISNLPHMQNISPRQAANYYRNKRSSIYIINNEEISTKYIFDAQLGTGYFGTVKLASPKNDANKKYACKSIDKTKLPEKKIANLMREIETLSMVDHPNIIKYYETYNDPQYFHIIMEYCTGGELFERIMLKKRFNENLVCNLIFKIASAIHHCHSLGVVHRDLKPENILFENKSDFSDIKIIDFGLSRKVQSEDDLHSIVGSPFYVAPEVLEGNYDEKCDIWSIGVIAFCLLSGKPPFYSDNREELFRKIKKENVCFAKKIWENISLEAIEFIRSLLNRNPKKRPNAKTVLGAKWFKSILEEELSLNQLDPEILTSIRKFHQPRQLTKLILTFIVKQFKTHEIEELNIAFNILDKEKTGFISFEQLKSAFDYCKVDIGSDELKAILSNLSLASDKSKNKERINYSSFITTVIDKKKILNKEMLWEAFKIFDTDQTGQVSIANIDKAFERTGKKKKIGDIQQMFLELGLQLDEFITFEQFCKIVEKDL